MCLPTPPSWGGLQVQSPWAFSIRGLRLYFPELEPWVTRSASLPAVRPVYLWANVLMLSYKFLSSSSGGSLPSWMPRFKVTTRSAVGLCTL